MKTLAQQLESLGSRLIIRRAQDSTDMLMQLLQVRLGDAVLLGIWNDELLYVERLHFAKAIAAASASHMLAASCEQQSQQVPYRNCTLTIGLAAFSTHDCCWRSGIPSGLIRHCKQQNRCVYQLNSDSNNWRKPGTLQCSSSKDHQTASICVTALCKTCYLTAAGDWRSGSILQPPV